MVSFAYGKIEVYDAETGKLTGMVGDYTGEM